MKNYLVQSESVSPSIQGNLLSRQRFIDFYKEAKPSPKQTNRFDIAVEVNKKPDKYGNSKPKLKHETHLKYVIPRTQLNTHRNVSPIETLDPISIDKELQPDSKDILHLNQKFISTNRSHKNNYK